MARQVFESSLGRSGFRHWRNAMDQRTADIDAQRRKHDSRTNDEADGKGTEKIGFEQAHGYGESLWLIDREPLGAKCLTVQ
jgi:hypothetical protein